MIPPVTLVKYSPQRMQGINKNAGKYSQSSWCRWTTFQSHGNICIHQVSIVVPVCVIEHSSWASIQYKFKLYHHWVGSLLYFFVFIHFTHTLWSEKKFEGNSKEVTYKVVVSLITQKKIENTVSTRLHQAVQVYNLHQWGLADSIINPWLVSTRKSQLLKITLNLKKPLWVFLEVQ